MMVGDFLDAEHGCMEQDIVAPTLLHMLHLVINALFKTSILNELNGKLGDVCGDGIPHM